MNTIRMASKEFINELYTFIYPLAVRAGEILMEGYNLNTKKIDIKTDFYDVVTNYDNRIEEFLCNEILKKYPDHKFICEEDTAKNNNITKDITNCPTWIIDPIDGTSNFIAQIPHTCVSIGLAINKEIVLGIVNVAPQRKIYTAKLGEGAFCNGQPIFVSKCEKINDANVSYEVSLLHAKNIRNKHIKRIYYIGSQARRVLSYSCVVDALCMVAAGNLDAFHIEDMYPWDCAAGYLLIKEAGGVITNPYGGKFDIMKPDLICAGTEMLRFQIEKLIRTADEQKTVGGEEN